MFYGLKAKEIIRKSQTEQFLKENTEQISSIKEAMEEIGLNLSTAEIGKLFMDADAADMDINEYIRSRLGLNPELNILVRQSRLSGVARATCPD